MISQYQDNDATIWIPVAEGKGDGPARAFLPFEGLHGIYRYGYKASPSTGPYFDALRQIQQAYINNESEVFRVKQGRAEQSQRRDKWRHGNRASSPLLGPTRGWVQVPVHEVEKLTSAELEKALDESGKRYATLVRGWAEPVLCESPEELERESARLFRTASDRVPTGQNSPQSRERLTEQFVRDAAVVAFILREANGACECCGQPAPFTKPNGLPYLEVHHVKRLASGGSDKISNAVAVCPNCHRELHHGENAVALAEGLYARIARLVQE